MSGCCARAAGAGRVAPQACSCHDPLVMLAENGLSDMCFKHVNGRRFRSRAASTARCSSGVRGDVGDLSVDRESPCVLGGLHSPHRGAARYGTVRRWRVNAPDRKRARWSSAAGREPPGGFVPGGEEGDNWRATRLRRVGKVGRKPFVDRGRLSGIRNGTGRLLPSGSRAVRGVGPSCGPSPPRPLASCPGGAVPASGRVVPASGRVGAARAVVGAAHTPSGRFVSAARRTPHGRGCRREGPRRR